MLTTDHIRGIKGILLSKRLTVTGDELPALVSLLGALDQEEKLLTVAANAARVKLAAVPTPEQPAKAAE
jgi:hypothetical protein